MTTRPPVRWKRALAWWPLWLAGSAAGLAVTLWFSLRSGESLVGDVGDKWQHLTGYGLLTLWFCGLVRREYHWRVLLACIAYGGLMEVLQGTLTVTRQADWLDVAANGSGALLAMVIGRMGLDRWAEWIERLGGQRS